MPDGNRARICHTTNAHFWKFHAAMLCCSVPVYSAVCLTREVIIYGRKKQKEKNTLHQNPRGAGKDSEEKEKKQDHEKSGARFDHYRHYLFLNAAYHRYYALYRGDRPHGVCAGLRRHKLRR